MPGYLSDFLLVYPIEKKNHIFDVLKYLIKLIVLASVIQKWIALDKSLSSGFGFPNGYPLDSDLSDG